MTTKIEQIQKIIDGMQLKNIPLMKKSEANKRIKECNVYTHATKVEELVHHDIYWGREIHTYEPRYGDPTYWSYDKGVEEKIKDHRKYKVWYTYRDASDPADSTTWYRVWYIEELPEDREELIAYLKETLKKLQ